LPLSVQTQTAAQTSQLACDLQHVQLITPPPGIKRRLPEINSPHRKARGVKPIDHYGMRHFFETRCIEQGVNIPTVSRWLGHQAG
jgi:hypothetical protein